MKIPAPVAFALGTALCWGLYGPVLANARSPQYSPFKPYVGIGLAYVVWACLGGLTAMRTFGDNFSFSGDQSKALIWGFAAGSLGALGALSLTTAMFKGGVAMPQVVMPVVFGGAVSLTAIVSVIRHRDVQTSPWLWVGIVGIVICIVLVAYHTPHGHPKKAAAPGEASHAAQTTPAAQPAEASAADGPGESPAP